MRKLLIGVIFTIMALAGMVGTSAAASASTVPVVYAAQDNAWHAYIKPGSFYFGNGGAPFITNLTWKSWGTGSAWGTGKLWTQKPGCTPNYKCPYSSRWTGVYLSVVRLHGSTRYYARMAAEFFTSGKARWVAGWFPHYNCGGCVAVWQFPAVFPYL